MIIDAHTHIWQSLEQLGPQISAHLRQRLGQPWDQIDASPQAHQAATREISAAFIWGFRSRHLGAEVPNPLIASCVAADPDRLYGFAGVDPMDDHCMDRLESAAAMKLSGVVVSPADGNYHPAHSRALRLFEQCQRMNMPVMVEQGGRFCRDSHLEYAQPHLFDEVARAFPQLRIVLAHVGHPWTDSALALLAKHRHVYATLSALTHRPWQLYNVLLSAHQLDVTDRLLFGSDFPHHSPRKAIEAVYFINQFAHGSALPVIPRHRLRSIVERDALECLGLRRSAAPARPVMPAASPAAAHAAPPAPSDP
jgi:hypothetical protein